MLFNALHSVPWTVAGPSSRAGNGWGQDDSRQLCQADTNQQILQVVISDVRGHLSELRAEIEAYENFYNKNRDDTDLSDLAEASDDLVLDRMYQLGLVAEKLLDRVEILDRVVRDFERCRDLTRVWTDDAGELLARLQQLRVIYIWVEKTFRQWSHLLCDEYERRHPELPKLPIEPLDLGPTNAARLPPVL